MKRERRPTEKEQYEERRDVFYVKDSEKHIQSNNVTKNQTSPTESSHEKTHEGHPW